MTNQRHDKIVSNVRKTTAWCPEVREVPFEETVQYGIFQEYWEGTLAVFSMTVVVKSVGLDVKYPLRSVLRWSCR
ncbi:hypothetical protein LCGC14_0709400 [marine sediment metagenome]|uniref:Uncharacterized protein n=1 Tax=marine sediment metagenome TaxID=412755 RepID=A0A0F9TN34_9ZZZZ